MTAVETLEVTEPGVVLGIPHEVYLADPVRGGSLSHSGAKTIVNKTPALFHYEREHGRPDKRTFDFGNAAHMVLLGVGPTITAVDADNWLTKAAKQQRDEIRAEGGVPILAAEMAVVVEMADAIRRHPIASKLLEPGSGEPEASAFAQDPDTGVWLRCRYDWLRQPGESGRLLLVDFKTANSADEESFSKAAASYGYAIQDAFYSKIARLLGLADDVAFLFVVIEKTPPYLVNVIQLDVTARAIGALLTCRAIDTYRACTESGEWPGYPPEVNLVSLPPWVERSFETELS